MDADVEYLQSDKWCRICLTEEGEINKNIFELFLIENSTEDKSEQVEEEYNFADLYYNVTGFTIDAENNKKLSQLICNVCVEKLLISYEFKKRSADIESKIVEHLRVLEESACIEETDLPTEEFEDPVQEQVQVKKEESEPEDEKQVYLIYDETSVNKPENDSENVSQNDNDIDSGERFKCTHCDRVYKSKKSLTKHFRIHTDDKRYKCTICDQEFVHWKTRNDHFNLQHNKDNWKLQCSYCDQKFYRRDKLNYHIKRKHTFEFNYSCDVVECGMKFVEKSELKKHLMSHNSEKTYHCPICPNRYKSKRSLEYHLKSHGEVGLQFLEALGKDSMIIEIIQDNPVEETQEDFKAEIKEKIKEEIDEDISDYIMEEISIHELDENENPETYEVKERKRNSGIKKYICENCGAEFKTMQNLKMHKKRYGEANLCCDLCGKTFKILPAIKSHMETVHIRDKKYQCAFCPYQNSRRDRIECHQLQHINPHPYSCDLCENKKFATKHSYMSHMRHHNSDKTYQCELCWNKFKYHQSLKRHMLRHEKDPNFRRYTR